MLIDRLDVLARDETTTWPFSIPAVRDLAAHGLKLTSSLVVLIGANGSGKSTLLEAIAEAYGIDVRGGHGGRRYGSYLDKSPLGTSEAGPCPVRGFDDAPDRTWSILDHLMGTVVVGQRDLGPGTGRWCGVLPPQVHECGVDGVETALRSVTAAHQPDEASGAAGGLQVGEDHPAEAGLLDP